MSTVISNLFSINGVIDTSKPVMENITTLANVSSSWVTFDINTGKWSIVINEAAESVASFNNNNIIGSLSVTGTGLTEMYNSVQLEFAHKDLNDQTDIITYTIPEEDRLPNEIDNVLNFKYDIVNNPVQAEYLAVLELKQSRLDKIVTFRTDFTKIGLKAGDIISITNSIYGFVNKKFRILSVTEEDTDDNNIVISIVAFEYDETIYNTDGLIRSIRSRTKGIPSRCNNPEIKEDESDNIGRQIATVVGLKALTGLLEMAFEKDPITRKISQILKPKEGVNDSVLTALGKPEVTITADNNVCEGNTVVVTFSICTIPCINLNSVKVPYTITGINSNDINVALKGEVTLNAEGVGTLSITVNSDSDQENEVMTITSGSSTKTINLLDVRSYSIVGDSSVVEGQSVTLTFNTVGIPNGTAKPFTITGSGVSQLSGVPTQGTLIINNNTATLEIQTTNQVSYDDTSITITFDSGVFYCSGAPKEITITHTGTRPPDPVVYNCEYVTIPAAWCGTWNASNQMISIEPESYISVLKAISGLPSATVPLTASIVNGQIVVNSTENINISAGVGGQKCQIITAFNSPTSNYIVTGSSTIEVIAK